MRRSPFLFAAALTAAGAGIAYGVRRPVPPLTGPGLVRDIDGESIHYIDEGSGPAIVLIHGFAANLYSWRVIIPDLAKSYRVVALDLPGWGYSTRRPQAPMSHTEHAHRVARFMDELGIDRAVIAGHSMGGGIAQRFASLYPQRTEALVLVASVDASEPNDWNERQRRGMGLVRIAGPALRIGPLRRGAVARGLRSAVFDPGIVTPDMVDGYGLPLSIPGTLDCVLRMASDSATETPVDLAAINVPTLVIAGEADRVIATAVTDRLGAAIPGARHVTIPHTAHLPAEEDPGAVLDALRTFLAELHGSQPPA